MTTSKPLSEYVRPTLDEARRARQFARISERVGSPRRGRRLLAPALGAVLVALLGLVLLRGRPAEPVAPVENVAVIETGETKGEAVTLLDGSRAVLDARSRLRLATIEENEIRLVLELGAVDVHATHDPKRSFAVVAAGYEVHVVGTRFRVVRSGEGGVSVSVYEGRVEVRRAGQPGAVETLTAGQEWSVALETAHVQKAAEPEPEAEPAEPAEPLTSVAAKPSAPPSAKQLFERAQSLRAQGKMKEAAEAFRTLRRLHPKDPRASIAAFELARIELDAKGDPKVAARALAESIESAPEGAPHREDAEARRVQALDAAGDQAACVAARNAYLARYPKGVHRAEVAARCKRR